MKGNKVSVRLRGHSGEQAQTTRALLYSASTQEKGKGESECMCKHASTSHIISVLESTFDTFSSLTLKQPQHKR